MEKEGFGDDFLCEVFDFLAKNELEAKAFLAKKQRIENFGFKSLPKVKINSVRFLWKSIPATIKESQSELVAAWKIGQTLWTRDYAGVYEAIRGFDWTQQTRVLVAAFSELYTKRMFELLQSAYSTISIQDAAQFLGMSEEDAANYVLRQGWTVDPTSPMLTVTKQAIVKEQKLDSGKLQRLTEYVFHLEH
ncbi:COP9 signalosome complex subunit 8-like [Hibiscus syriacus]|uniref:COP9 signalosome complex subunit 8-like n=1 Tax=Hibiscus syriacus TaxID=106335 RepID=UPI0019219B45|nr:COP9 signalosome complex subunit 8-like [Hibiscus syriacus]